MSLKSVSLTERMLIVRFLQDEKIPLFISAIFHSVIAETTSHATVRRIEPSHYQIQHTAQGSSVLTVREKKAELENAQKQTSAFDCEICVEFYFQKRGMYFKAKTKVLKHFSDTFVWSCVIPSDIYKKIDTEMHEVGVYARIDCGELALTAYPVPSILLTIPDLRRSHLLTEFPHCRFFSSLVNSSRDIQAVHAVQGKIRSAQLILLNELACAVIISDISSHSDVARILKHSEQSAEIYFSFGIRTVQLAAHLVSSLVRVVGTSEAVCLYFEYSHIKEEDRRFLYERYYGQLYEGYEQ